MAQVNGDILVTLGYLKTFIDGELYKSDGTKLSVNANGKSDSYCLTISDITGGSYVQTAVTDTGSPTTLRDGVVFSGQEDDNNKTDNSNNRNVRRKELSLRHYWISNLTASANVTNISACGGNSTISSRLTISQKHKNFDNSSGTTSYAYDNNGNVNCTSNSSAFVTEGTNGRTITVEKNGTVSSTTRSATITVTASGFGISGNGKSATVTISQSALTGDYSADNVISSWTKTTGVKAHRSSYTDGTIASCDAVTCYGYLTRNYENWERRGWKDSCGTKYTNVYNDYKISSGTTASAKTGSVSFAVTSCTPCCPTTTCSTSDRQILTMELDGFSDSVDWTRTCTGQKTCTCNEDPRDTWSDSAVQKVSVAACDASYTFSNISINGTHYWHTWSDCNCTEKSTSTSTTVSTTVTFGKNISTTPKVHKGTQNHISYEITQAAGEISYGDWVHDGTTQNIGACDTSATIGTKRSRTICGESIADQTGSTTVSGFGPNVSLSPRDVGSGITQSAGTIVKGKWEVYESATAEASDTSITLKIRRSQTVCSTNDYGWEETTSSYTFSKNCTTSQVNLVPGVIKSGDIGVDTTRYTIVQKAAGVNYGEWEAYEPSTMTVDACTTTVSNRKIRRTQTADSGGCAPNNLGYQLSSVTMSFSANCTTSPVNLGYGVTQSAGPCCSGANKCPSGCECKCSDITVSTETLLVGSWVGSASSRRISCSSGSLPAITVSSDTTGITVSYNSGNGDITCTKATCSAVSATISINVDGVFCKSFKCVGGAKTYTITHDGNGACLGGTVTFTAS